jgi:hypothetical protein
MEERIKSLPIAEGLEAAGFIAMNDERKWFKPLGPDFNLILKSGTDEEDLKSWDQMAQIDLASEHDHKVLEESMGWHYMRTRGILFYILAPLIEAQEILEWKEETARRNAEVNQFNKMIGEPKWEYLAYALKRRLEIPEEGSYPLKAQPGPGSFLVIEGEGEIYSVERYRAGLHIRHESSMSADFLCSDHARIAEIEEAIGQWIERDLNGRKDSQDREKIATVTQAFRDLGYSVLESAGFIDIARELGASNRVRIHPPMSDGFHLYQMRGDDLWKHERYSKESPVAELAENVIRALQNVEGLDR